MPISAEVESSAAHRRKMPDMLRRSRAKDGKGGGPQPAKSCSWVIKTNGPAPVTEGGRLYSGPIVCLP
ncbi:hypothetical protein GCM10009642_20500 [Nocardiopsis metallicus]